MNTHLRFLNCVVAAIAVVIMFPLPSMADSSVRLGQLYHDLAQSDTDEAQRIAKEIELEWSKSGSAAMDLLLKRGNDALETGDIRDAIEHLTALTDHAPEFAQGWHMRAVAHANAEAYGPAVADLERALALNPRHYNALASLGAILAEIDRPQLAIEAYEKVLTIHPHHKDVSEALTHLTRQVGGADL